MRKLISKLLNRETVITDVGELYEIKGYLKDSLFSTRRLYRRTGDKEWKDVKSNREMGDIYELSNEQLLRGRV